MTFSKRHNFATPPPITIRTDAPGALRDAVVENAYDYGLAYSTIRKVICLVLSREPNRNNWTEIPNIRDEALGEIKCCEWFKVYGVAEALLSRIEKNCGDDRAKQYAQAMNDFFINAGIGWQFAPNGKIVYRGDETFRVATAEAARTLLGSGPIDFRVTA